MIKVRDQHKVIILAIIGALVVWVADAAYDSFISREGPFLSLLANVRAPEPYLRIFLTVSLVVFGIFISRILEKRSQIEEKLKKHATAIEASMDGIAIYSRDNKYIYVNQAYAAVNGYKCPEDLIGKSCHLVYDDQEYLRMEQTMKPLLQKNGRWRGQLIAKRKNGSTYFQEASITMLEDGGRVCIIRDITWRKRSEERLQRSERFLNTIFNSIRDPFCIFDNEYRIIRVNDAYAHLKNKRVNDLIGRKCFEVLEGRTGVCEGCVVDKTFSSVDPCAKDKLITLRGGTEMWVEIYTYPILDENGRPSHVIEYTRDITERKKSEDEKRRLIKKLEHLSRTDSLTGLINRRALAGSLVYEIDRAKRFKSELSLILCDIDNFKEINDTYGHDAGDRALQALSATLKTILRKTDIAGRYGGDEFMLILPQTSIKGAAHLAEKLLAAVKDADLRLLDDKPVRLSMSIGIAGVKAGVDRENIDSLVKRADDAMYASKQSGKNRVSTVKI
jgi:diguanylate cyclase (GGDEF)-like protein/PAS domain S-box-containing protein